MMNINSHTKTKKQILEICTIYNENIKTGYCFLEWKRNNPWMIEGICQNPLQKLGIILESELERANEIMEYPDLLSIGSQGSELKHPKKPVLSVFIWWRKPVPPWVLGPLVKLLKGGQDLFFLIPKGQNRFKLQKFRFGMTVRKQTPKTLGS